MASLKEIKVRIASIQNTQKITSAMKMVSSAKLHHAQGVIEQMLIYEEKLNGILLNILTADCNLTSSFLEERETKRVVLVPFSSSTGLCGGFNANIEKELSIRIQKYIDKGIQITLFPVGKKIADSIRKRGINMDERFIHIGEKPTFGNAVELATELMRLFCDRKADRIELLYHHFKNRGEQPLMDKTFLPVQLPEIDPNVYPADYLMEPSPEDLLNLLLPKVLHLIIYTVLMDSSTAEHAARMLAMQTANDNANDLIQELTRQYNKTRQQAITNELLDIMGGKG